MARLCVFCGSSPGSNPHYMTAAESLGREMAERAIGLVYGGARVGLMGAVADAVMAAGGEAIGVLPAGLETREVAHRGLTELLVVPTMHERKRKMAELADGFVALPGGLGTLDELFEIWTWALLGIHEKPIGILNVFGYFDPLMAVVDHAVNEGFARAEHRNIPFVATSVAALLGGFPTTTTTTTTTTTR